MTGFAEFIGSMRGGDEDRPGALARAMYAPDPAEDPPDDDERQANLMAAGLAPGQVTDLARRYGDTLAELAGVREANEAARRRQERTARDHAAGRITAFDIMRMDTAGPDMARERQLGRRAESLRRQLADAQALVVPAAQRAPDPVEAAVARARDAHREYVEVTRQKVAEAEARRPAARRRAPFPGRGAIARSDGECPDCRTLREKFGATEAQCFLICNDPDAPIEKELVDLPVTALAEFDREDEGAERRRSGGRHSGVPGREITRAAREAQREGRARLAGHEVTRVCAPGDDGELRNYAPDYGLAVR